MKVHEKIKLIRNVKAWSQEDIAAKLAMSVNGYANIERGETDIPFSRLEQIAGIFEMDLAEFFNLTEKNVFNFSGDYHSNHCHSNPCQNAYNYAPTELQHTLEKTQLINAQLEKENALLKEQLADLREVISLLKK